MCGISGFSGAFSKRRLAAANDRQAHRGPDGSGLWFCDEQRVGLGHRRLSIIDLSETGAQPMLSDDGTIAVVFNGEIYNYRELKADLQRRGARFRGESDTEVIIHLYQAAGEDCLRSLNGMFSLAIWDGRRRQLVIARDPFGVKPLYYSVTPDGFAFASEIKSLLSFHEDRRLDPISVHRYLTYLWCPGVGTPLEAVRKMAPGELFIVADGKIRERKTWFQLPSMRRRAVVRPAEDPIRQAEAALRLAVQRQLVADVPVGCFLSGGLDSSAIATFAAEMQPGIPCFTIEIAGAQEVGAIEDLPYARQVAKGLGLPLHVVTVDSSGMARDLPDMVAMLDEPLADPAALNVLYISRLARRLGIKVLLSGTGGDDLFGGYRRHLAGRMDRYLCWIPGRMRRTIGAVGESAYQSAPVMRRAAKFLQGMDLSGDQRLVRYLEWPRRDDVRSLYSREFAQLIEGQEASAPLLEFLAELPESTSTLERQLALDQRFFLADHNLIYTDKMSMAAGVEVRVPFLDVDLADFAAQVPENLKLHRLEGKWILKKAMETYLPHEIVYRPKTGFGAPVRRWMQADLKGLMNDILGSTTFRERGLFDVRKVEQLLDKTGAGEVDGAYLLLAVMAMELWCQTYADQVPAPAM